MFGSQLDATVFRACVKCGVPSAGEVGKSKGWSKSEQAKIAG